MDKHILLLLMILCSSAHCHRKGTGVVKYISRSMDTVTMTTQKYGITECFRKAQVIADDHDMGSGILHYAILWVAMYSQKCEITRGLDDEQNNNIYYMRLNKELRCMFKRERNQQTKDDFFKLENVTNRGIKYIFELQQNRPVPNGYRVRTDKLYRGVSFSPDGDVGELFIEEGFFSASRDITTALFFTRRNTNKILFIVSKFHGADISAYSFYPKQTEILGMTGKVFRITARVDDKEQITDIVRGICREQGYSRSRDCKPIPNELVYIEELNSRRIRYRNRNAIRTTRDEQRNKLREYCGP